MGYKSQATKFFQEIEISAPWAAHSQLSIAHDAFAGMGLLHKKAGNKTGFSMNYRL